MVNKKSLKLLAKILVTGLALFLVFRKIDTSTTWSVIKNAQPGWLVLSWIFFIISKVWCSFRLNGYFRDVGLKLSEIKNLKLYAIGMFYNLFLPGGIGGDGYKVYILNKIYKVSVKKLLAAVFLDRGNGLAVILFLTFALLPFLSLPLDPPGIQLILGIVGMLGIPFGLYIIMLLFFKNFMSSIFSTTAYSLLNQVFQLWSTYFILISLGVSDQVWPYLFVFLVSSLVSVIPLTIGGVGARELVFVYAHAYVGIDKNTAVAFSLLFFILTVLTSLSGVFFKFSKESSETPLR
ncbi:MAG: lysylphosphatidylglycerol synthase transmembrane domain-containing protein [Cyclobacteriaceae bacterium]